MHTPTWLPVFPRTVLWFVISIVQKATVTGQNRIGLVRAKSFQYGCDIDSANEATKRLFPASGPVGNPGRGRPAIARAPTRSSRPPGAVPRSTPVGSILFACSRDSGHDSPVVFLDEPGIARHPH
ncbi:hypothetical protein GCM10010446_17580 [Streptomyces enissocaesilis]|uniref:Uncharacterized protein n=1 Tax=Streptomyces enissocaesilis TaxID=332589 RepID=A0ABP6JIT3_9ACTN